MDEPANPSPLNSDEEPSSDKGRKARKEPRKLRALSPEYFRRAALHYLDRYNGTSRSVRQLLQRRVTRARREGQELDSQEIAGWIDALISDLQRLGLINDGNFAIGRARSLHASGQSLAMIRLKLQAKGINSADIDAAIERLKDERGENLALEAARTYVRKRRLGPYRPKDQRADKQDKDLAALARRGFSYDIATAALKGKDEEF